MKCSKKKGVLEECFNWEIEVFYKKWKNGLPGRMMCAQRKFCRVLRKMKCSNEKFILFILVDVFYRNLKTFFFLAKWDVLRNKKLYSFWGKRGILIDVIFSAGNIRYHIQVVRKSTATCYLVLTLVYIRICIKDPFFRSAEGFSFWLSWCMICECA